MITIYLLTKKNQFIFSISFVFNFKKKTIYNYCIKIIYNKISIWTQKLFLLKNNEFLQFYLQKYLDSFLLKKEEEIFTNYLK